MLSLKPIITYIYGFISNKNTTIHCIITGAEKSKDPFA